MNKRDLRVNFFMALSKLRGVDYDSLIAQENRKEVKALIDELIFQELPKEDKEFLKRRAKTHRMQLPPTINSMADNISAQQQIISITSLMEAADTWDEFKELQKKRASKKDKPFEGEEPLSDFDRILLGVMSVPKSDIDNMQNEQQENEG